MFSNNVDKSDSDVELPNVDGMKDEAFEPDFELEEPIVILSARFCLK